jgi:hypothetical protein
MQFNTKLGFCPKQNLFSFEKYAEVHMHMNDMMKFPNLKSRMLQVDTNRLCQEIDLVPPWTLNFTVAKDQVLSCLTSIYFVGRVCHQWHTSAIPLKTSQPCDVIQEDLQLCTSQININGSTTAIKFLLKRESRRMETSTTMANHDPRMNRTNPKYRALLGLVGN